ncbi:hypothetical protein HID58_027857, partial [Brassica napus]
REKRERKASEFPTSGGASARVPASVTLFLPVKSRFSAVGFDLPHPPTCRRLWARVLRQEGLGSYGAPDGGDAVFSGSGFFRLLISHLKRLVNVGGVGSMVDGFHETLQIVFVCVFGPVGMGFGRDRDGNDALR